MAVKFSISQTRAIVRFTLLCLMTSLSIIPAVLTYHLHRETHENVVKLFFTLAVKIMGIKVGQQGFENIPKDSVLFVSNHTSYLDILVLGSKIKVRFTPKIEISKWPILNFIVNLSLPVYIHRNASKSIEQKQKIREIIEGGDSILMFPESTTNDGREVLPFKSSLFSVTEPEKDTHEDDHIAIQPISIVYTHIDGEIASEHNMDKVAWYGDMKFLPHFWKLLGCRGAKVKILYHSELYYEDFGDRKTLSKHCEDVITKGVEQIKNEPQERSKNFFERMVKH
jgi:1-acyl-sn-glycerol-3-phosphate acyltransferase